MLYCVQYRVILYRDILRVYSKYAHGLLCFVLLWLYNQLLEIHVIDSPVYRETSNISRTLVGNTLVDYSDVVGASLVRFAPATSSLST